MDKPYTTYEEQLIILEKKHLTIPDRDEVVELLKRCSYFGLITGYKHPFKDKEGNYKIHTTINDIYALYTYDMELRELFLKYILIIENHIKSVMSYSFCESFGDLETDYLNANNYNYIPLKQADINKLLSKLRYAMNDFDNHPYLQHQRDNHGNIPMWVLMKVLTIGIVSKMYSVLKPQTQTLISKEFAYISEEELSQMIDLLSRFRNVCAHNERLYDFKYLKSEIRTTDVHKQLKLKKRGQRYLQGKKDLFAVTIVFKYLLEDDEIESFVNTFKELTDSLLAKTSIIERNQILKLMGFPEDWEKIKNCPKRLTEELA